MSAALSTLRDQIVAPIAGPAPAGADVTYEPAFERLRQAVDRLASVGTAVDHESVAGDGSFAAEPGADHADVVAGALEVLTEHAKDLRAAAYLVASLAHAQGTAGLAAGIEALTAMAQAYWADLHPSRPRARRAAFEFLTARLSTTLSGWDRATAGEREPLEAALAALSDLQVLVASEMGDDAPALSGLRRELSERLRRVPAQPISDPAPEPSAPAGDGAASASPPPPPASDQEAPPPASAPAAPVPPAAAPSTPSAPAATASPSGDPVRAVVQAAAALREATPGSAAAVRLTRVVRWDVLAAPPPATDHATRIEPPPARRREAMAALAASDPATFAEQAEQAFAAPPFHFWLDLQRMADQACAALGHPYADARHALRDEAARLVGRLPTLLDLQFRDGTPFADSATRAWALGLQPATSPAAASGADADDLYPEAHALAVQGDLGAALAELGHAPQPGRRAEFIHRLQTAELCLVAGRADVAYAIVTALSTVARDLDLDAWEPRLAADLYATWARAAGQTDRPDETAQAEALLAAVAPARAL